jgi:hypothetical protein
MTGSAKQSTARTKVTMDCFVALLLAMTTRYESAIPRRIAPSRVEDEKGGHTVFAIPPYVELTRIVGGQIGRPNGIVFDQVDGDVGGILAFMDELF